jgi:putative transcriptional regulator
VSPGRRSRAPHADLRDPAIEKGGGDDTGEAHRVVCHLDQLLADRQMTLTDLAQQVGVTVVNLSILKNNRARAVRFSTLTAICDALHCQPGDVFSVPTTR